MNEAPRERDRNGHAARPSVVAETLRVAFRQLRRLVVFVIGITVVLIGTIMFFTPGPAVVVIPIGLGILALEFAWARMLLKRFKERAEKLGADVAERFRKNDDAAG
ncbi:MAG: PGPGW domain-containing protein [Gammaproteobacteria bacterium]|nr:PGPGW domain-containing protein [Gammaproteobacteria bacterium]